MPQVIQINQQPIATSTPVDHPRVQVAHKHHLLVRWSHWLNVPILLGLILSGIAIYWASPVYQHKPDPQTGNFDYLADVGIWICAHVPGLHHYSSPPDWIYNHISLGPGMLGVALRLHWLCAYLFLLNGLVYVAGLIMGGGWRFSVATPHRSARRSEDVSVLYGSSFCMAGAPHLPASTLQHKVQPATAHRLLFYSGCRISFRCHGLGDSQADAALLAGCDLRGLRQGAYLAFLVDVGFCPLCRAACDLGSR